MGLPDNYYLTTLRNRRHYPALAGLEEADVCIIGAGLAGINTALSLISRGKSVVVVEQNYVGYGASGRQAGFVAKGYAAGEASLRDKVGPEQARKLVSLTRRARALIRDRAQEFGLAQGTIVDGVLTVSLRDRPDAVRDRVLRQNADFDLGLEFWPAEKVRQHCKTEKYFDGIFSPNDFQMNPVQYLHGLAGVVADHGGRIFENSPARTIVRVGADWEVRTEAGRVRAKDIVFCCSCYSQGLDRRLENAVVPVQTYIMVTEPLSEDTWHSSINTRHALYDTRFCSDYYRRLPDDRLLWGGRVGLFAHPSDIAAAMTDDVLKIYPQLEGKISPAFAWSGLLAYAAHKMPQIGMFERGYWYNTAYGGHGLCPTTIGGEVLAAAIAEGDTTYQRFAPFGVGFSGGKSGRYAAQVLYGWWKLRDFLGI